MLDIVENQSVIACHSSEIRYLGLMKLSCEMLKNLPYFWNKKTKIFFFHVSYRATLHLTQRNVDIPPGLHSTYVDIDHGIQIYKSKNAQNENEINIWTFLFQKYGKF